MIEKDNLIYTIADIDIMALTPMEAMNTLYKLTLEAKKIKITEQGRDSAVWRFSSLECGGLSVEFGVLVMEVKVKTMKRINLLDEHTSNNIAAGEVVERPSSVVKELVENSIDAEAKNITIEVEQGGISLIRIIDDGNGIHKDDVKKAFLPHATSKIKNVEDIYSINSLGFRGEALASVAAVAKVLLKTKIDGDEPVRISIEGGEIQYTIVGTTGVNNRSKDLFVPQDKFLKSTPGRFLN